MVESNVLLFTIAGGFVAATCYPALSGAFDAFAVGGILGLILGFVIACWALARSFHRLKSFLGERSDLVSRFMMGILAPQLGSARPPSVPSFLAPAAAPAAPASPTAPPTFRQNVKVPRDEPTTIFCSSCGSDGSDGDLDFVDNNGHAWHKQCFTDNGCYICHMVVCNNNQRCATEHGVAHYTCHQTKCRQVVEDIIGKIHSTKVNQLELERAEKAMSALSSDGTRSFLHSMKELVKINCPNSHQKPGYPPQCVCGYWLEVIDKQLAKRETAIGTTSRC